MQKLLEIERNGLSEIRKNINENGEEYLHNQGLEAYGALKGTSDEIERIEKSFRKMMQVEQNFN